MTRIPSDLVAALTDVQIVVLTLYGEARGESIESQIAVGCVIRNRLHTGRWGASYAKVCLAPYQFSCWRPEGGKANHETVLRAAEQLARSTTLPEDQALRQCAWVAQGIMGQWIADTVRESTHYVTADLFRAAPPKWAAGKLPACTVGGHVFFAGVA
jgi:hypothetical protein